ncbi:MAG: tripartite tricarboxylate transporter substrate binding protein [Betaproteobacteria bacterium]|nr:tripartite tricarboxylate transporter substrate binding protein [Betaproteobacteria bacterium]PWB63361.1 MAG: MFS transporter [Betaproteobacteria bacterium]
MKRFVRAAAAVVATTLALAAQAQAWPTRAVKVIVPFAPGGFTDVVARILQTQLSAALGQPVVIENKPGAGSTIGTAEVAKARPDGYTIAMVSTTHVITPSIYKQMPYDALRDFTPVMKLAEGPYVLVVHPSLPARTVKELVELAKAEPGKIDYASSGNGSSQHLVGALFGQMAGVKLNHVPYKGSGQAMQDLVGGQVKVSFVGGPNAVPYLANGKLRALGVTTSKRSADLPDIPTIDEAGVAGYDATLWLGLLAPPGTPAEVVAKLREGVTKALSTPEARKLVNSAGVDVALSSPEEFATLMKSEMERWGKVVRETGATVN